MPIGGLSDEPSLSNHHRRALNGSNAQAAGGEGIMAKRKKKPQPESPRVGNIRAELASADIENPLFAKAHTEDRTNPRMIGAFINVRESAITMLAAKGVISAPQAAAAVQFRQLWERLGGAGAGAMDYSRTVVDGGKTPEPISAMQMEAGRELKAAQRALKEKHGELR